jgi:hypothetical protein
MAIKKTPIDCLSFTLTKLADGFGLKSNPTPRTKSLIGKASQTIHPEYLVPPFSSPRFSATRLMVFNKISYFQKTVLIIQQKTFLVK